MLFEPPAPLPPSTIRIEIEGYGHIVSFKNTKMILPAMVNSSGQTVRRAMLITDPRKQKLMWGYEVAIELALLSAYRTAVAGMPTAPSLQSWIASSVFLDDSLDWIPESAGYTVEQVEKGDEGMVIEITRLPDLPITPVSAAPP
jgi:hypothetical protein